MTLNDVRKGFCHGKEATTFQSHIRSRYKSRQTQSGSLSHFCSCLLVFQSHFHLIYVGAGQAGAIWQAQPRWHRRHR